MFAAAVASLSACAEWTTPEALPLKVNTIANTNPELYAKYTQAVRDYKASEHHVTYVAFDNIYDVPTNAVCKVNVLPDSVDFVEMTNPGNINSWTADDMEQMRKDFGTKFILRISFPAIAANMQERYGDDYLEHIKDGVDSLIAIADAKKFDGITVEYEGTGTLHAYADEIALLEYKEDQIFPSVLAWKEKNAGKLLFFNGNPHHTVDHSIVFASDYVILATEGDKSAQKSCYTALQVLEFEENGATPFADCKIIFAVKAVPDDITDTSTGQYFEGEALDLLTRWLVTDAPESCAKAGLAVYLVQNDCLSTKGYYPKVRAAIKLLNPNS